MKKLIFLIIMPIMIIGFSGCKTQSIYPKYNGKNATILYADLPNVFEALLGRLFVSIVIDDSLANPFDFTSKPYYLKPGKHTIIMYARSNSPSSSLSAKSTITFDFKGYRKYQIKAESFIMKGLVVFSLFDITGKEEKILKTIYAKGTM